MNKIFTKIALFFPLHSLMYWFFFFILGMIVVFLLVFMRDTKAILLKQAKMPLMELYGFDIYQADEMGIQTNAKGVKALRYAEYEVAFDMILSKLNFEKKPYVEYMYGKKVVKKDTIYDFQKGGVYARDDGTSFWSKSGIYDAEKSIFSGQGMFWMSNLDGEVFGVDITYNQKQQTMHAYNIKANIALKDQKQ